MPLESGGENEFRLLAVFARHLDAAGGGGGGGGGRGAGSGEETEFVGLRFPAAFPPLPRGWPRGAAPRLKPWPRSFRFGGGSSRLRAQPLISNPPVSP